jgi:hypothetical protein
MSQDIMKENGSLDKVSTLTVKKIIKKTFIHLITSKWQKCQGVPFIGKSEFKEYHSTAG